MAVDILGAGYQVEVYLVVSPIRSVGQWPVVVTNVGPDDDGGLVLPEGARVVLRLTPNTIQYLWSDVLGRHVPIG